MEFNLKDKRKVFNDTITNWNFKEFGKIQKKRVANIMGCRDRQLDRVWHLSKVDIKSLNEAYMRSWDNIKAQLKKSKKKSRIKSKLIDESVFDFMLNDTNVYNLTDKKLCYLFCKYCLKNEIIAEVYLNDNLFFKNLLDK